MFGNMWKLLFGIALIGNIMSENCFAGSKVISGELYLNTKVLKYSVILEKKPSSKENILSILFSGEFPQQKPKVVFYTVSDKPWMINQDLNVQFLTEVSQEISKLKGSLPLPHFIKQLSKKMEKLYESSQVVPTKTISEPKSQSYLPTLNRYSSQNSLIELLGQRIVGLIKTPSNPNLFPKIERVIRKLLSDPEPNKEWILFLITELKTHEATTEFYKQLEQIINVEKK